MLSDPRAKVVIGWDVRGWMSKEQAVAVLVFCGERIEWLGYSERFKFPQDEPLSLSSLLKPALESDVANKLGDWPEIIVAIDAPLALPTDFCALANGSPPSIHPPKFEIENSLAYRECERWVRTAFGKKPLSATFDKLGNNASLAITLAGRLRLEGFRLDPQDAVRPSRSIIEVYPGLTKEPGLRNSRAVPVLASCIPSKFLPGTDIYDAAICALLGAMYLGWGAELGIPGLVEPKPDLDAKEGWIYCLPPEYVREVQGHQGP